MSPARKLAATESRAHFPGWSAFEKWIEPEVVFASLTALIPLGIGPITAVLVATQFSPTLQGYYYTFGSLLGLRILAEFGFGQALVTFVSHEFAKLSIQRTSAPSGDPIALSRLRTLTRGAIVWHIGAAALVLTVVFGIGVRLFLRSGEQTEPVSWLAPWTLLCAASAAGLVLSPMFAVLQGCGYVREYWKYRLLQQIVNGVLLWTLILSNAGLWANGAAAVGGLLWSGYYTYRFRWLFKVSLTRPASLCQIDWFHEFWPLQWRVGVTFLSSSFTLQLLVPILFWRCGPVVAGQYALTATLCSVLFALSTSWFATRAPRFGLMASRQQYRQLFELFRAALIRSTITATAGFLLGTGAIALLGLQPSLASRVLPLLPSSLLLASVPAASAVLGMATLLRAFKRERLLGAYTATTLLTVAAAVFLARPYGVTVVALAWLLLSFFVLLPITCGIFFQATSRWRAEIRRE